MNQLCGQLGVCDQEKIEVESARLRTRGGDLQGLRQSHPVATGRDAERGDRWSAELQAGLGISKANLSQHLGILKSAGLVGTRRQGKQLYCGLSMPEVKQAMTLLRAMSKIQVRATRRTV